jgi:hypothetical protein
MNHKSKNKSEIGFDGMAADKSRYKFDHRLVWDVGRMQMLYDKTTELWAQYNFRVSDLPPDIRARHARIHHEAMVRARELGWIPDSMIGEDES